MKELTTNSREDMGAGKLQSLPLKLQTDMATLETSVEDSQKAKSTFSM